MAANSVSPLGEFCRISELRSMAAQSITESEKSAMSPCDPSLFLYAKANLPALPHSLYQFMKEVCHESTRADGQLFLQWRRGVHSGFDRFVLCRLSQTGAWKICVHTGSSCMIGMMNGRLFQGGDYVLRNKQPHGLPCGRIY